MTEYVTQLDLLEVVEVLDHLSFVNAFLVVVVYDISKYLLFKFFGFG